MKKQKNLLVDGEKAYVSPSMEMIELYTESPFASGATPTVQNGNWSGDAITSGAPMTSGVESFEDLLDF
jgi:hypothetical protein